MAMRTETSRITKYPSRGLPSISGVLSLGITGLASHQDSPRTDDQAGKVVRDARAWKAGSAPVEVWHVMGCTNLHDRFKRRRLRESCWSSDPQPRVRDAFACRTSPPRELLRLLGREVILMELITDELIESGKSASGGWSKAQLQILGVAWPPQNGWKAGVIGKSIQESDAKLFLSLRKTK